MKNFTCILIDDEVNCTETLKHVIKIACPQLTILKICNKPEEGIQQIKLLSPDLVFLDVEMPKKNGFDVLKSFEEINFEVIFTTSHDKYALLAIKFSAIDYLLKPIDIDDLKDAVEKFENKKSTKNLPNQMDHFKQLFENLSNTQAAYSKISVPTVEGLQILQLSDIVKCEGDGNYTTFYLLNGQKIIASRNLKEYEDLLETKNFMRIHNSYIINIDHVKNYVKGDGGYVVMVDKSAVDVSRRRKDAFLEKIKTLF